MKMTLKQLLLAAQKKWQPNMSLINALSDHQKNPDLLSDGMELLCKHWNARGPKPNNNLPQAFEDALAELDRL